MLFFTAFCCDDETRQSSRITAHLLCLRGASEGVTDRTADGKNRWETNAVLLTHTHTHTTGKSRQHT